MTIIKCKMCGGDIALSADKTFGTCEYCGCAMTLPAGDDEQRAAMFNRGNHFRRIGEFDKALAVYERVVEEDDADAEAHWCCALCRFGIEYVEDPETLDWVPTCHRASFDSFLEDVDYKAALERSDGVTRRQYQKDAAKIASVQRGILAASRNEEPFDVFLCYKESDESGGRTVDSALAQDIYYELAEEGLRVFFARITLEDKAGSEYEPYIFAALHSARVMVAVGTRPEHFNAVWVRNEWSRFLALMRRDRKKLLIPCYKDMDPYALPEQLSALQSYDMERIGFIQDLIRGVKKVLDADKAPKTPARESAVPVERGNLTALLKRGGMALEDGEWQRADDFFEQALNLDAECAEAYFGKSLAACKCHSADEFKNMQAGTEQIKAEKKTICTADVSRIAAIAEQLRLPGYLDAETIYRQFDGFDLTYSSVTTALQDRLKEKEDYFQTDKLMSRAMRYAKGSFQDTLFALKSEIFSSLQDQIDRSKEEDRQTTQSLADQYKAHLNQAEESVTLLRKKAEQKREADYVRICAEITQDASEFRLLSIAEQLDGLGDYKDSIALAKRCRNESARLADEFKAKQEADQKRLSALEKRKKIFTYSFMAAALAGAIIIFFLGKKGKIPMIQVSQLPPPAIAAPSENAAASGMNEPSMNEPSTNESSSETEDSSEQAGSLPEKTAESPFEMQIGTIARHTISAGSLHAACIKADDSVIAAGRNNSGQCDLESWSNIKDISAGDSHTVGLKQDGSVVAAGSNSSGQCKVDRWSDIVAVSAGHKFTAGLKSDGTVQIAGYIGRQYSAKKWSRIIAVAAGGYHAAGLKDNGKVVVAGNNRYGECNVKKWKRITAVAAGDVHTVGLKQKGTVVATGANDHGQCNVTDWSGIIAISAGDSHTAGLKKDGTVVATGANDHGQCNVAGWSGIVAISAGNGYTLGLKADGTLVATGTNEYGQCDLGKRSGIRIPDTPAERVLADGQNVPASRKPESGLQNKIRQHDTIATGNLSFIDAFGIKTNGSVILSDDYGSDVLSKANWTNLVSISAGNDHVVGLKADGTVVAGSHSDNLSQCNVGSWRDITAISAGYDFTAGLKSDGTVIAVGHTFGNQGSSPGWSGITAISASNAHLVGLKADGTVVAAGSNGAGQCDVGDWSGIIAVFAAPWYTAGLKADGSLLVTGNDRDDQSVLREWLNIVDLSFGKNHAVGLKADGTVVATGNNDKGQCNVSNWRDIVAVSAGSDYTIGLKSDGSLLCTEFYDANKVRNWTGIKLPER